uniref:Uncharacterized protein n=1 Tax=Panagrolaimus sp. PS1159 TaxID=55785 RepID=A0AC35GQM0_9BILA
MEVKKNEPEIMQHKADQILMGSSIDMNAKQNNNNALSNVNDLRKIKFRNRIAINTQITRLNKGVAKNGAPFKFFTCAVEGSNQGENKVVFLLQCFGKIPGDTSNKGEIIMRKVESLKPGDIVSIMRLDKEEEKKTQERRLSANWNQASNGTGLVYRVHEHTLIKKILSGSETPITDFSTILYPMENVALMCKVEQDTENIGDKYMIVGHDEHQNFVEFWFQEKVEVLCGERWNFVGNVKFEEGTPCMDVKKWNKMND